LKLLYIFPSILFFNAFGQNLGLIDNIDLNWLNNYAREPILFKDAINDDNDKKSIFFHRVDQ